MLASLLSKPQPSLSAQAKRLVAMRFLIYTGFQTSYFIGVISEHSPMQTMPRSWRHRWPFCL